jgi:hypothetical protein
MKLNLVSILIQFIWYNILFIVHFNELDLPWDQVYYQFVLSVWYEVVFNVNFIVTSLPSNSV